MKFPAMLNKALFITLIFSGMSIFSQSTAVSSTTVKKEKAPKDTVALVAKPEKVKEKKAKSSNEVQVGKVVNESLSTMKFGKKKKGGIQMMSKGYYFDACDYFQSALNEKPKKWKLLALLADANMKSRNYVNAENFYSKLSQTKKGLKKFPLTKYNQGLALKAIGNYPVAIDTFKSFLAKDYKKEEMLSMKKFARREIQGMEMADTLSQRPVEYKLNSLNGNINTAFNDYAPFSLDPFNLYFSSQRGSDPYNLTVAGTSKVYSKFYESKKFAGDWSAATEFSSDINAQMANSSDAYVSADGKSMYYTRKSEDESGVVSSKIFVSENNGTGWTVGKPLNENINDVTSASKNPMIYVNAEGKEILYFASNRLSGRGAFDIYYSMKSESGEFGRAKNAGSAINTTGNEVTPFFDAESRTLYFSSDGQINLGGLDVFKALQSEDGTEWKNLSNLGTVINSSADDYYFRPAKNFGLGYLVSNRKGGNAVKCETCSDDVYTARMVRGNVTVMGTVTEDINGVRSATKEGVVEIRKTSDNSLLTKATVKDGRFSVIIDKENEAIYLSAKKTDFEDSKVSLNIGEYKPESIITEMTLKRTFTYVGTKIGIVFFDYDKFGLRPEAPDTLNKVLAFIKQFPNYVVEVGGHTDDIGRDIYNDSLGFKRAAAVNRYILSKDIPSSNTVVKTYGKKAPLVPNKKPDGTDNPEGRQMNRRVEFIVVGEKK
jgi:outer membrane protein OmpA-like peptidoglycan-associated protein/tetratricopeptide (TPR) repeat protein